MAMRDEGPLAIGGAFFKWLLGTKAGIVVFIVVVILVVLAMLSGKPQPQ